METTKRTSNSAGQPATTLKNRFTRSNGDAAPRNKPTHEQIASLACLLYIESGCQEGRDAENWLRAEQTLRQQAASARSQPKEKSEREIGLGLEPRE
jgi:hypothetical protein